MRKLIRHLRIYVFRGILVFIPLGLSFFVVRFFYIVFDRRVVNLIDHFIGFRIPGLGIILILFGLYALGYLTSNVIGKYFLDFIERVANRIPIVKTTYQVGKQLSFVLSLPERQVFKRVVLVDYFKPGMWVIGFVTGVLVDEETGETLLKIFIPTVPNPTSGILVVTKESQTIDPHWTVEEAMRMVISGGIIGPEVITAKQHQSG